MIVEPNMNVDSKLAALVVSSPHAMRAAKSRFSWRVMESRFREGMVDEKTWRWYRLFWEWTALRMEGAGQALCFKRLRAHGFSASEAADKVAGRIRRVRAAWESAIMNEKFIEPGRELT